MAPAWWRSIDPARFDDLPGGYDPGAILGADDRTIVAIREDLANLGPGPDARAFASFVRAMLQLRPLAREAGWAGYRAPRDEGELARAELAWRELDATRARIGRVPVVAAQAMLVATLVCRLDEARAMRVDREPIRELGDEGVALGRAARFAPREGCLARLGEGREGIDHVARERRARCGVCWRYCW